MKFEIDYDCWNKENIFAWLEVNVGPAWTTTSTWGIGPGWEVRLALIGNMTIEIEDRDLATAFALRFCNSYNLNECDND